MLQAKMLKSLDGGRTSIFSKGRKHIPFANGALDSDSFEFEPGKNKELYFRSRLLRVGSRSQVSKVSSLDGRPLRKVKQNSFKLFPSPLTATPLANGSCT